MNKLALSLLLGPAVALLLAACGGGDKGSPAALEQACKSACKALAAPGCKKFISEGQCESQCPYLAEQLQNQCIAEYTDLYSCAGGLQYTCMQDVPFPANNTTACVKESQAAQECMKTAPCKSYCEAAVAAGCGGASQDACEKACKDAAPSDSACENDYERYRTCESKDLTCKGGNPTSSSCDSERSDLLECVTIFGDDPCGGYCILAADGGCNTGTCKADCQATLTQKIPDGQSCDFQVQYLQECEAKSLVCDSGKPALKGAMCDSEEQQVASCLTNSASDICLATCWYADRKGCAKGGSLEACRADCKTKLDAADAKNCKYQYQDLLGCEIQQSTVCSSDVSLACDSYQTSYDSCIMGM